MSKCLDAFENIFDFLKSECVEEGFQDDHDIVTKELKRLAKIDCLFEEIGIDENDLCVWFEMQKQDGKKIKALEIIKAKKVQVNRLNRSHSYKQYNLYLPKEMHLTQEEYDLLKEVML